MKDEKRVEKILKEIEKKFLGIRGWKNWEEYDNITNSNELDKNVRNELLNISITLTIAEKDAQKDLFVKKLKELCNDWGAYDMKNDIDKVNKEVFGDE